MAWQCKRKIEMFNAINGMPVVASLQDSTAQDQYHYTCSNAQNVCDEQRKNTMVATTATQTQTAHQNTNKKEKDALVAVAVAMAMGAIRLLT